VKYDPKRPILGWKLPSEEDGTPVGLDANLLLLPPPMRCIQVTIATILSNIENGSFPHAPRNEVTRFSKNVYIVYSL
jgi:hypothetical protein